MSLSQEKIQIASIAVQYLASIQNYPNSTTRDDAIMRILGMESAPRDKVSFGELFRAVFDEIESTCTTTDQES